MPSMAATVVMMAGEVRDDMTPVYADAPVDKNLKLELNIPPNKNKELTDTFKYQAKIDKRFNAVERAIQSENRQPSFPKILFENKRRTNYSYRAQGHFRPKFWTNPEHAPPHVLGSHGNAERLNPRDWRLQNLIA